jgi:curved DNA-binding protein CbpA
LNLEGNYYEVLGVLSTADEAVISAAYRALAKKYHPDVYPGDADDARRTFERLTEAYETLKDANLRKEYDAANETYDTYENTGSSDSAGPDALNDEWDYLLRFFPEAGEFCDELTRLSPALTNMYKMLILENPETRKYSEISATLQKEYFERYFGTNEAIVKFAKQLVKTGQISAAKDLNAAVKFFGKSPGQNTANRIILKVGASHNLNDLNSMHAQFRALGYKIESKFSDFRKTTPYVVRDPDGLRYGTAKNIAELQYILSRIVNKV